MNDNRTQLYGATLYVPAIHPTVENVRTGSIPTLGSMVICLEDSIRDDQVGDALKALKNHLATFDSSSEGLSTYVRPRDAAMAEQIMRMPGARGLRGFVIPKATPEGLQDWMSILRGERWAVMPTIETAHAFDVREVHRLRDQTTTMGIAVDAVRIGGNDILSTIGARRSSTRTLYDGPLGPVVTSIVGAYAGTGISLSSPVLEHYSDECLLLEEIDRDIEHGIYSKTVIHPKQVAIVNGAMRPTVRDVTEAQAILATDAAAVFKSEGSMCEPKTHAAWAKSVLDRQRRLGVKSPNITITGTA